MRKRFPYIFAALLVVSGGLIAVGVAHAELTTKFVPLAEAGLQGSKLANLYSSNDLSTYINNIFKFAIGIGAIAAVLRLAYAGYLYMGQSDMWSHKGEAKTIIGDVTLGLLLLLAIWLILYQINPDILKLNALRSIQPVSSEPGLQAGLQLQEQHVDDFTTNPQEYPRTVGPTPQPGQYCYPSRAAPGNYSCVTNEANCITLAESEGATCALTPIN